MTVAVKVSLKSDAGKRVRRVIGKGYIVHHKKFAGGVFSDFQKIIAVIKGNVPFRQRFRLIDRQGKCLPLPKGGMKG